MGLFSKSKKRPVVAEVEQLIQAAEAEAAGLQARLAELEGEIAEHYGGDTAALEAEHGKASARLRAIENHVLPRVAADLEGAQGRAHERRLKALGKKLDSDRQALPDMRLEIEAAQQAVEQAQAALDARIADYDRHAGQIVARQHELSDLLKATPESYDLDKLVKELRQKHVENAGIILSWRNRQILMTGVEPSKPSAPPMPDIALPKPFSGGATIEDGYESQ